MRRAKDVMNEFMETLKNMEKYRDIQLNPIDPNYDEFEQAFKEEKKIVKTYEASDIKETEESRQKLLCKKNK